MAANHKLTTTIQGRTIKTVQQSDAELIIQFEDGSAMHVKLAEPTSSVLVRSSTNEMEYAD